MCPCRLRSTASLLSTTVTQPSVSLKYPYRDVSDDQINSRGLSSSSALTGAWPSCLISRAPLSSSNSIGFVLSPCGARDDSSLSSLQRVK